MLSHWKSVCRLNFDLVLSSKLELITTLLPCSSLSKQKKWVENSTDGAPTMTLDSQGFWQEVVDQAALSGFSPFALWPKTFHWRSCWSTYIWAPSAGEVNEARARKASSHIRVLLILLIPVCSQCRVLLRTRPLLSPTPVACLLTNSHIISQQQFGNSLSLFSGQTGEQTVVKSIRVYMFDWDRQASLWKEALLAFRNNIQK